MDVKECTQCGKGFQKSQSVSRERWVNSVRFCSRACRNAAIRPPAGICERCGERFDKRQQPHRKFCSRKCYHRLRSTSAKVERTCRACGTVFIVNRSQLVVRPVDFCSDDCRHDGQSEKMVGDKHHAWSGGRIRTYQGYIRVWVPDDHPMVVMRAKGTSHILEHRLVMAKVLGRALESHETVHHKNGKRDDNRPENLELRTGKHGRGATKHCPTCTCGG